MELQQFVNQVIREICAGIHAAQAGAMPPYNIELDVALTSAGKVCTSRIKFTVELANWPKKEGV